MTEKIPVFLSCDDNYAIHASVVIASILDNSKADFEFVVIYANLSEESKQNIRKSAKRGNIEFIYIDNAIYEGLSVSKKLKHIRIETCFRFLIPELKPDLKKAIYLDSDVVVCSDLKELFSIDISENYAGVVSDYAKTSYIKKLGLKRYFNAGVLLLNLEKMRSENITKKLFEEIRRIDYKYFDQDVLNVVFSQNVKFIDPKWNAISPLFRKKIQTSYSKKQMKQAVYEPAIVHFTGPDKPWLIPYGCLANPFTPYYFKCLANTPFADRASAIKSNFLAFKTFFNYLKRRPLFFLRPQYYKMRCLYLKNLKNG